MIRNKSERKFEFFYYGDILYQNLINLYWKLILIIVLRIKFYLFLFRFNL